MNEIVSAAGPESVRALLDRVVDFAGLSPPAVRDMVSAARAYERARTGAYSWMLGRLVLPATQLPEFEEVLDAWGEERGRGWRISAMVLPGARTDMTNVRAFNERQRSRDVVVDAIETRAETTYDVDRALDAGMGVPVYVEVAIDYRAPQLLERIKTGCGRAKVRLGGVAAWQFPDVLAVARFLARCVTVGVPFKATAGLHHPLAGTYPITYERGSAEVSMYGFLNVLLATVGVRIGLRPSGIVGILTERIPAAFQFFDEGVTWRGIWMSRADVMASRTDSALSITVCSFREPMDGLRALCLI